MMYDTHNTDECMCRNGSWMVTSLEIVISLVMVHLELKHVGECLI